MDTEKKTDFRELKSGKVLCIGARTYKGNVIKVIKDKKGKEKKDISISSTRMVPETLIKQYTLNDKYFVSVSKVKS